MTDSQNAALALAWLKDNLFTQFRDCWDFVRRFELAVYNIDLPEIVVEYEEGESKEARLQKHLHASLFHAERKNWQEVKTKAPTGGALVEMSHSIAPHHIGVWIDSLDGGIIAHYLPELGLQFQTIIRAKAAGWRGLTFYEHV